MRSPSGWVCASRTQLRGALHQALMVILINVPTVQFGLALGWVSLVTGEAGGGGGEEAVFAAVTTFVACFVGVPLSAKAITYGRKFAVIAASACFVVCWSLKLASLGRGAGWMLAGRGAAGVGGAAAWALAPLLAREMCSAGWRGAAVSALPLAHNAGVLLMYLAADARLAQSTVMWWCLGVSACHCFVFLLVPESPAFLAAKGDDKAARAALAWLRGRAAGARELDAELRTLPPAESRDHSSLALALDMLRDRRRRTAFMIGGVAVVGQEACGVLAVLQYAERLFVLARAQLAPAQLAPAQLAPAQLAPAQLAPAARPALAALRLASPTRLALLLGGAQLVASAASLYLVERLGRRTLIVWCAWAVGGALAAAAAAQWAGRPEGAALALAAAVAVDAAGLQSAPYALLSDMFHYEYRGCAMMLVTAAACAGNAVEVGVFPALAARGGVAAALTLAATLTLAYAVFATLAVPETRLKTPEEIYDALCPRGAKADGECDARRGARCDSVVVKGDKDCRGTSESQETSCTKF